MRDFRKELQALLEEHCKLPYTYINPHLLAGCVDALEGTGTECSEEIHDWIRNMWSC